MEEGRIYLRSRCRPPSVGQTTGELRDDFPRHRGGEFQKYENVVISSSDGGINDDTEWFYSLVAIQHNSPVCPLTRDVQGRGYGLTWASGKIGGRRLQKNGKWDGVGLKRKRP